MIRHPRSTTSLASLVVAAALGRGSLANAACPATGQASTCLDADTLWPSFGPTRLASLPATTVTPHGKLAFGLTASYLSNPIRVRMESASATPIETPAVHDLLDMTLVGAFGILPRLEIGLALPFTAYRTGTGLSSVTSQRAESLPAQGLRDVRVGASYALLDRAPIGDSGYLELAARFELSLPTGDSRAFGTNGGLVGVPAIAAAIAMGRFWLQAVTGARVRGTTDVLGTRVGSQLWFGVGGTVRFDDDDRFRIGLEAFTLPTLSAQYASNGGSIPGASGREEVATGATLVPTEWLASVHAAPFDGLSELSFTFGVGGPIQLGDARTTMPNHRFVFGVAYAPSPERQSTSVVHATEPPPDWQSIGIDHRIPPTDQRGQPSGPPGPPVEKGGTIPADQRTPSGNRPATPIPSPDP